MKISLCIPQYNRIQFLLKNLELLSGQTYLDIEIVISDDASSDETEPIIQTLIGGYKYPIVYYRNPVNIGYDANLRKSLELATGKYCVILGNDDSLNGPTAIADLVRFLTESDYPEIGFCNFVEDNDPPVLVSRAAVTGVVGSGKEIALKYYRSFSFVAGIIIRKDVFDSVDTNKADGSIYVQIYLAARIIASGGRLFTYVDPMVRKDLRLDGVIANSYRDKLIRKWKDLRPLDGGLKSVTWAVTEGFKDAGVKERFVTYKVMKNIYRFTYPYWLIDYRENRAFVAAIGMVKGLNPSGFSQFGILSIFQKAFIYVYYATSTVIGLLVPVFLFKKLKYTIYKFIKR